MHGFSTAVLDVDLSAGSFGSCDLDPALFRKYLGGSGISCSMLFDEPVDLDPLAPESKLVFFSGLLTGTPAPASSKVCVSARSPLTGIWGESAAGGIWPSIFRTTGYDGIVIHGESSEPVILIIDGREARLAPAGRLWGKDTFETHEALVGEYPGFRIASIGPGGENGVLFAAIMFDGRIARAAGRCGMGAIMGAKKLKAILVRGSERLELADRAAMNRLVAADLPSIKEKAAPLTDFSTAGGVEAVEAWGDLAIKNWRLGSYAEGAKKTAAQHYFPKAFVKHRTCRSCPLRCAKDVRVDIGPYTGSVAHGPEYETICGFGANCLNDDYEVIIAANEMCNRFGIDTISASSLVAFAMEAYENGLITKADTGGVALEWGSAEAILDTVKKIAFRQDAGDLLSQGAKKAAEKLGGGSDHYAVHVKGLEMPYHDPRAFTSMAANYATAARGGCHLEALTYFVGRGVLLDGYGPTEPPDPHTHEGKALLAYQMMNYQSVFNPLGLCKFLFIGGASPATIAGWAAASTGWDIDRDELMETGERLINIKRLYNLRRGVTAGDDRLPGRLQLDPKPDGKAEGVLPDTEKMVKELYSLRGWNERGEPTGETLNRFELGHLAGG